MTERCNIGYELVTGPRGYSFRILKKLAGADKVDVIQKMDCPVWFASSAAAEGCANDLIRVVVNTLRQRDIKVEAYRN